MTPSVSRPRARLVAVLARPALVATFVLTCCTVPACQSPEERTMDRMDRQMRTNTKMMKRMEKSMEQADREMSEVD